jgi:hypothetical protein
LTPAQETGTIPTKPTRIKKFAVAACALAASATLIPASRASALDLLPGTWFYSCAAPTKLRTYANVNGPTVRHGLGPNYSSLTFITRSQNSSTTIMYSEVKWAYSIPSAAQIKSAGNLSQGWNAGVNCW